MAGQRAGWGGAGECEGAGDWFYPAISVIAVACGRVLFGYKPWIPSFSDMALSIVTNTPELTARRNLGVSEAGLARMVERISSGLRVNSARDDAAGLAISERMQAQVRGQATALRNANDGVSIAQTAEGALGATGNILQRVRELAVQSANATNSPSDRQALQAEVVQLISEVDRVAQQTQFNGQKLLDGSFSGAVFQVGANVGDTITVGSLVDTRSPQLSTIAYNSETVSIDTTDEPIRAIANYHQPIAAGALSITVGSVTVPLGRIEPANSSGERLAQVVAAINNQGGATGMTAFMSGLGANTQITLMSAPADAEGVPVDVTFNGFSFDLTGIRGVWEPTPASYMSALTAAANATPFVQGDFDRVLTKVVSNNTSLPYEGGSSSQFAGYKASPSATTAQTLVAAINGSNTGAHYPPIFAARQAFIDANPKNNTVAANYASALNVHFGAGMVAPTGSDPAAWTDEEARAAVEQFKLAEAKVQFPAELNMNVFNQKINQRGVNDVDISTQPGTWVALLKMDSALTDVNGARATLGAVQSRFEAAINTLAGASENTSAARSRIVDADFAVETAQLARQQILQNAATAMTAQANAIPQQVMALLNGL